MLIYQAHPNNYPKASINNLFFISIKLTPNAGGTNPVSAHLIIKKLN